MASERNQRKQNKKRKRIKKVVATTIDEAYIMYMKLYDNRPPTASRFKKFINDEKRVQMGQIDFVTCDTYLRSTGRGRKSSGASSHDHTTSSSSSSRRKLNITRPKSKSFIEKQTKKSTTKHKRSTKSGDYKDDDKYARKKKYSNNKSRAEKPVTSLATLTNTKLYKNKYGTTKSSVGRKQKTMKKIKNKKTSHNNNKNRKNNRKNGTTYNNNTTEVTEHVEMPNDEELAQLINEIPSSPALNSIKKSVHNSSMIMNVNSVLKSFPFIEHMLMEQCHRLKVNDKIDHRYIDGQYLSATILAKNGSKVKLNYDKYGPYQSKYDIWSDYKYEIYRFAKRHSITLRAAHRMIEVTIGDFVDINPKRHKKKSHRGWKVGEVIKRDYKSGQVKIEYTYKTRKYEYWTHLDNINEISPFATMVVQQNMSVHVLNSDGKMNKALEFANRFPELDLDTGILTDLTAEKSGFIDEEIQLDYKNIDKWSCDAVMSWFGRIENGRFGNDNEYEQLRAALRNYAVNGKDLLQFNDVFLRMVGVGDANDRKVILTNIKSISPKQKKIRNGHVRNLSKHEIDNGIKKATQKYSKENKQLKSQISKLEESNQQIKYQHQTKLSELDRLQKDFAVIQQKKKKIPKEVIQLRRENERINNKLIELTSNLTQQTQQLNDKNDELRSLRKNISHLNKEIQHKNKQISSIKSESQQKIIALKMELQVMVDKCKTLNVNDVTKNSKAQHELRIFNDDNKYNFDNNDEINTPHSIDTATPESSVSVVSVNSPSPDINNYNYANDVQRTIIIDNGSETIKIGYGSTEMSESHKPSKKFHSIIGTPKHNSYGSYAMNEKDIFIGDEAYNKSSVLNIKNVINRGDVIDWEAMEKLWDYTFFNKLNINRNMSNINILLTERVGKHEKSEREKAVQTMFENYSINSMFLLNEGVLSLYGVGKITGTVLGIGYGVTYTASIFEGMCLPGSIIRINSSGYDITKYLQHILSDKYSQILRHSKHSIFKDMKQKYCFVADNFHESLKLNANSYKKYKLPDGQSIRIGNERFRATEQLFGGFINLNNEEMSQDTKKLFNKHAAFDKSGVHHMVNTCINLVPDKELKRTLYSNIVLSGGSTLFKGLTNRLQNEIVKLTNVPINIIANEKRKYLAWIGGSIVSSLSNYMDNFIQKSEYEEQGARIVHMKCP